MVTPQHDPLAVGAPHPTSPSPRSTRRRSSRRAAALVTCLALALVGIALILAWADAGTVPAPTVADAASGLDSHLPHLVSGGWIPTPTITPYGTPPTTPTKPWPWPWPTRRPREEVVPASSSGPGSSRTLGMVNFGESIVELQNLSMVDVSVDLDLHYLDPTEHPVDTTVTREIGAVRAVSVELKLDRDVVLGNYSAHVASDEPVGVLARTTWDSGAMAVYEAPEPSTRSILPLFAVDAISHTTVIHIANTHPDLADDITMELFDIDGSLIDSWTYRIDPGRSETIDPEFDDDYGALPATVGDGLLGAMRFSCGQLTAVSAYGDEPAGRGVSAFVARPVAAANKLQYLPVVRSNVRGDSLISVVNSTDAPADVTITYTGMRDSPSGAGRTYRQSITLGPRYYGLIDLDVERARGNMPVPALPRGAARDQGFAGSAAITASAPVLAMVLDQDARLPDAGTVYTIETSAAYNAFGPADIGRTWIVPRAYAGSGGRRTDIVVHNPSASAVTFRAEWGTLPDELIGTSGPITLAAGQTASVTVPADPATDVQALVRADAPVAVLVYDNGVGLDQTAYWAMRVEDRLFTRVPTMEAPPTITPTPGGATDTPEGPTIAPPTPSRTPRPTSTGESTVYMPSACRRAYIR